MLLQAYIHIDVDAYYAQAEAKKLNISPDKPLCARQWNILLAINYPARAFGIQRCMTVQQARELCPEVLLPHVDTFRMEAGNMKFSTIEDKFKEPNRLEEKISLQYYRDQSKLIFNVIRRFCSIVEKGGIDEAYIQLTDKELNGIEAKEFEGGLMEEITNITEEDHLLMKASVFAQQIRKAIYEEVGYTTSAGISFNKMLSKLASAIHKPNKQMIILKQMLPHCIRYIKVGKLRGFGGKVKQTFDSKGITSIGQAQDYDISELFINSDEIYQKIRGIDNEQVKPCVDTSISSMKSFRRCTNRHDLKDVMELVICDISMRIADYYDETSLLPYSICLVYYNTDKGSHQKGESLMLQLPCDTFKAQIEDKYNIIFKSIPDEELFPMVYVGLTCRLFKPPTKQIQLTKFVKFKQEIEKTQIIDEIEKVLHPEIYYLCNLCGKEIAIIDQIAHDDYHYAISIDQQVNPNKRKYKLERQSTQQKQF